MKILMTEDDFLQENRERITNIAYIIDNGKSKKELAQEITEYIKSAAIGDDIYFLASQAADNAIERDKTSFFAEPHTRLDIKDFVRNNLV